MIRNFDGVDVATLQSELDRGAKFIVYRYCISLIVITFRRTSDIYFVRGGRSRIKSGLKYSLLTFLLGWWGIPWGIVYTISSLSRNFSGGKDVTAEVLQAMAQHVGASKIEIDLENNS